jgi:hypothetical protein
LHNILDAVDIDTSTHIGIGCKFSKLLKSISTSWAPSYHATLTLCIQFSALGEQFVLNIEPYLTISCEPVCYKRMELKHKIELHEELENMRKRKNKTISKVN